MSNQDVSLRPCCASTIRSSHRMLLELAWGCHLSEHSFHKNKDSVETGLKFQTKLLAQLECAISLCFGVLHQAKYWLHQNIGD